MFKKVDRYWASDDADSKIKCRAIIDSTVTLRDLLDYIAENYSDVSMLDMLLISPMVSWIDDPTEEEKTKRETFEKKRRERQENWERETYLRLKEKYGD